MGKIQNGRKLQTGPVMIKPVAALLLLLLTTSVYAQQMQLQVIQLNHRTADQVINVIRPLISPGGTVTGMNDQLIVKTTPANLAEIKQILATIDQPQRRLMITVSQGINRSNDNHGNTVSGQYGSGNSTITGPISRQAGGITISGRDSDGNIIQYNINNSSTSNDSSHTYSVQSLEGEPAFIQTGQSVPVPSRNTVFTRNGVVVQDTVDYVDASSGFYVVPRISGNMVTLMVAPRLTEVNIGRQPTFEVQNVQTTVSGRLGEWIDIGGLNQTSQRNNQTLLGSSNRQQTDQRSVLIKVDEIR